MLLLKLFFLQLFAFVVAVEGVAMVERADVIHFVHLVKVVQVDILTHSHTVGRKTWSWVIPH